MATERNISQMITKLRGSPSTAHKMHIGEVMNCSPLTVDVAGVELDEELIPDMSLVFLEAADVDTVITDVPEAIKPIVAGHMVTIGDSVLILQVGEDFYILCKVEVSDE